MSVQHATVDVSLSTLTRIDSLEVPWRRLEQRSRCTFFTSWSWIGCWLRHLPRSLRPLLLEARANDEVVGLAILIPRRIRRHHVFPSNAVFLNETGDPKYDQLTIEHNGFLCDERIRARVIDAFLTYLVREFPDWHELYVRRIADVAPVRDSLRCKAQVNFIEEATRTSYFVDLDALRAQKRRYIDALSANTRYQIRRSLRAYEKTGEVRLDVARTREDALLYLRRLKKLHQAYWNSKGEPGAFANPFLERFHHGLITQGFERGEIQLTCLSVGGRPVGYLYNLVRDGCVYNYQSGFDYAAHNALKPGLVTHYLTIVHNMDHGMRVYDFLAGDSQYKRSLGTHSSGMAWVVVRRDKVRFQIQDGLKQLKRRLVPLYESRLHALRTYLNSK